MTIEMPRTDVGVEVTCRGDADRIYHSLAQQACDSWALLKPKEGRIRLLGIQRHFEKPQHIDADGIIHEVKRLIEEAGGTEVQVKVCLPECKRRRKKAGERSML